MVDLPTVSFLNQQAIIDTASDDEKYYKMPFLYLITSYARNQAMNWANEKYSFIEKRETGSWIIYKFSSM